jgi:uncharacterized protein
LVGLGALGNLAPFFVPALQWPIAMKHLPSIRIGVVSDTHGLIRPNAKAFLAGCDRIIHGGDICDSAVLEELSSIAPVTAVRGNNDHGGWAQQLSLTELIKVESVFIYVVHDLADLDIDPQAAGVGVVVSGHSHQPLIEKKNGVLYVNPGSAGPRRFKLPISIADITVCGDSVAARWVELE